MGETYASTSGVPKLQRGGALRVARGCSGRGVVGVAIGGVRHGRHPEARLGAAARGGCARTCARRRLSSVLEAAAFSRMIIVDDVFTPRRQIGPMCVTDRSDLWSRCVGTIRNVPPHLGAALRGAKVCGLVPLSARRGAVAGLRARGCGSNTRGPLGDGKSHAVWEWHGWSCSGWPAAAHASSTGFGTCTPLGVPWADEGWFGFSCVRCAG